MKSVRHNLDSLLRRFEKQFITHNLIEVSQSALLHNLDLFASLTNKAVIPVLKGNAYGHGIELVASALKARKLAYIAVDGYFEALAIRQISDQPVLILGSILPENYSHMRYDEFAFAVQDEATIHALGKTRKHIKLHLECNTGFNRYGVGAEEISGLIDEIKKYPNLELEGVMSHLADADGDDPVTVYDAVSFYDSCVEAVLNSGLNPTIFHVAQTAGSIQARSKYANTIRLGVGLYGINPFPKSHTQNKTLKELRPALRLTSTITKISQLEKGDKVSYNYTFTAPRKMRIAVLPLGYYEGVNRSLSNSGVVKIGQAFAPIVGRVCMNHTMVALDSIDAKVGDKVVVYSDIPGDKNAIDNVASDHGLFNYNLLTSISPSVRRVLVD